MKKRILTVACLLTAFQSFAAQQDVYIGAFLGDELVMTADTSKSLTTPTYSFNSSSDSSTTVSVNPPYGWKVSHWVSASRQQALGPETAGFCERVGGGTTSLSFSYLAGYIYLAAKLVPIRYNIVFLPGDSSATGSMSGLENLSVFDAVQLPPNSFVLPGRAFRGWGEDTFYGSVFGVGETVYGASLGVNYDQQTVALTAKWANCNYRVTFDANGGTTAPAAIDVTYSGTYPTLGTPTWAGHTFTGWYTARDGGTRIQAGNTVSITAPTTLYAHWTTEIYTVTYKVVGEGRLNPPVGTYPRAHGSTETLTAYPDDGHLFAKWEEDGSVDNPRTVTITDAATWTAVFTARVHTVTFKYRTTRAVTETQYVGYGESATAPSLSTVDKRPGYTFAGWDPSSYNPIYEDKIVTAQYDANIYYVCFQPNGDDVTGAMTDQEMECGTTEALNKNKFKRAGYGFVGWNTAADGSGDSYADQEPVCDLAMDDGAEVLLYAQWEARQYRVSFDANGGDGAMAPQTVSCGVRTPLVANAFTRTGYTFAGWATNGVTEVVFTDGAEVLDLVDVDQTAQLKAVWAPNTYYVRFDANGGLGTMPIQTFTYDQPQPLLPNAYEEASGIGLFAYGGWSNLVDGVSYTNCETVLNLCAEPNGTNVLTAIWLDNRTMESKALRCVNLQWEQKNFEEALPSGSEARWQETEDGLAMNEFSVYPLTTQIKESGSLHFRCRRLKEGTSVTVNVNLDDINGFVPMLSVEVKSHLDWQNVEVPIKLSQTEESKTVFIYLWSRDGVELAEMTWEPTRPRPLTLLLR